MKYLASIILAWFAFGISLVAIAGQVLHNELMRTWVKGGIPMAVSTATAILSLALSVILQIQSKRKNGKNHP